MRSIILSTLVITFPLWCPAQLTAAQQKALNNYVDYANQSAEEVTSVVRRVIEYYPAIHQKRSFGVARFVCPVQLNDFYYNKALNESSLPGAVAAALNAEVKKLRGAAELIDRKCKALDIYHKLEDYKQDNFTKALALIDEIQTALVDYRKKQFAFQDELEKAHKKLNTNAITAYAEADAMMRKQLLLERSFLELWMYNAKGDVHTGWIEDKLEKSITETDAQLKELKQNKPALNYPTSSMLPSFESSLQSILETKRRALNEYNYEAKKSDHHKNRVYLDLINYYNGALLSFYNSFIGYAQNDKYYGLKAMKFVPLFEIREQAQKVEVAVTPFNDIPHSALSVVTQKTAISKPAFEALTHYVAFINETHRQVSHWRNVLRNLNSSASYYKSLTSFSGRGGLTFSNKDFVLPLSQFQKAVAESKVLAPAYAKTLNEQAGVLLNILKEMQQHSAALELEVQEKRYEKDHLNYIYEILERNKVLIETWDERKEQLNNDLRSIFDSYPPLEPSGSWYVSGKALRELTDLDHDGLFKAKAYYKSNTSVVISTEKIDANLREVISNEYDNMKGIQKFGRNHGLCPYTPYEDLPKRSKQLSENLQQLKPAKKNDYSYSHPYHALVYTYNDIVEYYNKFCELSPVSLLKTVKQPELFAVVYPEPSTERQADGVQQQTTTPQPPPTHIANQNENQVRQSGSQIKVIRDTVYIERRDTVYLHETGENLRSMEGYATNNMVLLLDVSGSMNAPEKLPLLKKSILDLLSMMRQEDQVSIIIFSGKPKVLLQPSSFKDESKIRKAVNELKPSGKTDGNAGIKLAYKTADGNYMRGGNNRIVLATDGEFPISDDTKALVEKYSKEDIFLSVFNFGKRTMSAKNLEQLSVSAKGNYEYISKDNIEMKLIREVKAKKK